MNKKAVIITLSMLVGLLVGGLVVSSWQSRSNHDSLSSKSDHDDTQLEVQGGEGVDTNALDKSRSPELGGLQKRSVERRPLEPEATKRLHDGPVVVSSVLEASGKAEWARFGGLVRGSYLYTTTVMAHSEVLEKSEDKETGQVHVKERRKFLQARDSISLSELDVALALDTLPVDQIEQWAKQTCCLVSGICVVLAPLIPPAAPWLVASSVVVGKNMESMVSAAFAALHRIDGTSARGLLGSFGVEIPANIEQFANERMLKLAAEKTAIVRHALQTIEGKSFLIMYEQAKDGAPLKIDYQNEDGTPITDAEWEILRSANAFLDSNVVPDTRCRVGDSWTIWADEVVDLFGIACGGRVEGEIRVERESDQPDGEWTLKVEPSTVEYRGDSGVVSGKMEVKGGNGLVDAKNVSVKSLQVTADGNLRSLNKERHFLFFDFVKRIKGDSNLRFSLSVAPAKAEQQK